MGQPAGSITVALGESLKARLVAAARAAGTTPSVLARRAGAEAVGEVAGRDETAASAPRNEEPLTEIRIRVPESAAARFATACRACGLTRPAYASAAMVELAERSASRPGVTLAVAEIESAGALREAPVRSNATLAPIGRNLNEVARAEHALRSHFGRGSEDPDRSSASGQRAPGTGLRTPARDTGPQDAGRAYEDCPPTRPTRIMSGHSDLLLEKWCDRLFRRRQPSDRLPIFGMRAGTARRKVHAVVRRAPQVMVNEETEHS